MTATQISLPAPLKLTVEDKRMEFPSAKPEAATIHFKLTLHNGDKQMAFDYSGGCLAFASHEMRNRSGELRRPRRTVYDTEKHEKEDKLNVERFLGELLADAKPDLAGCLHSLLSDARTGAETFAFFCSDFGYDTDSRKAYATWQACQDIRDKMNRVLGEPMISELETLLSDY